MSIINSPIISIIIPTYNSGKNLSLALDSIVDQTFKNFEIIIIDGLSNDNTIEIAQNYSKQHASIRIYSEKDEGIYDAMNKGIDKATGEWLYFMGSDDSFYETTTLHQFANRDEILDFEVVYGNVYSDYFNGSYDGVFTYAKVINQNICHQSIFFKKSVFKKTGKYNLKYKSYADWDHNIKWFFSSKISYTYIDQIIANFSYGGFSSVYDDKAFKSDKIFIILSKGISKLKASELLSCCNNYINYAKQESLFSKLLFAYLFKVILMVLIKIRL